MFSRLLDGVQRLVEERTCHCCEDLRRLILVHRSGTCVDHVPGAVTLGTCLEDEVLAWLQIEAHVSSAPSSISFQTSPLSSAPSASRNAFCSSKGRRPLMFSRRG